MYYLPLILPNIYSLMQRNTCLLRCLALSTSREHSIQAVPYLMAQSRLMKREIWAWSAGIPIRVHERALCYLKKTAEQLQITGFVCLATLVFASISASITIIKVPAVCWLCSCITEGQPSV
ncbi:uncharacterized protein LOC131016200 [Salvia miltiorrhiza]|uniref:uncharacterized protein LOC131016200 n=1 Tax=Salvia miltiorrhiza TaxID=226208 RepID=UPI0025AC887A|nr:uncharacterized protein LOC131016200 [Salvia miltiorrhiza]